MRNKSLSPVVSSRWSVRKLGWIPASVSALLLATRLVAYPPAPHHVFYGLVRDEYGTPLTVSGAEVILTTPGGRELKAAVFQGGEAGVNYRLEVPMDAGLTDDVYQPTAMQPTVPFQMKVVVNKKVYLPMELKGKTAQMGLPGKRTQLDLTLGEDTDGDGLPDAWERMIHRDIRKVNPTDDPDGDGLTNLQEYLAGTYALDASDGLRLDIQGVSHGEPLMRFVAIRGRTYTLLGSTDFKTWEPVSFRIPSEGATAVVRSGYQSATVTPVTVQAVTANLPAAPTFFRLRVQ